MKICGLFLGTIVLMLGLNSCIKGESYCEPPANIIDAFEFASFGEKFVHAPSDEIRIYITQDTEEGTTNQEVLYSFSTPTYFVNPKGAYTEDIVNSMEYVYRLKDTTVYADSIPIKIYAFNDCARSIPYETYILFE